MCFSHLTNTQACTLKIIERFCKQNILDNKTSLVVIANLLVHKQKNVANSTINNEFGCSIKFAIKDHENVPMETILIIATSATIGIFATLSLKE